MAWFALSQLDNWTHSWLIIIIGFCFPFVLNWAHFVFFFCLPDVRDSGVSDQRDPSDEAHLVPGASVSGSACGGG